MSTHALTVKTGHELQPAGADLMAAFAEFLRLRVGDGAPSAETVRSYHGEVGRFVAWCRDHGIDPGTAQERDLEAYRRDLVERDYKHGTVAVKLAAVKRFYEAATWRGLRADNPAGGLRAPRDRTDRASRIRYLPLPALGKLLNQPPLARDRAILYLMAGHGLRVAEVAQLQVDDLDLVQGTMRVLGKGDKTRVIYLTQRTTFVLRQALQERKAPAEVRALFLAGDHREPPHGMTSRGIRHVVDGHLRAAGLKSPGTSCHALRHSFATWSLAAGADLLAIGDKLGHASQDTTAVYARITDARRRNPTARLEALIWGDNAPNAGE